MCEHLGTLTLNLPGREIPLGIVLVDDVRHPRDHVQRLRGAADRGRVAGPLDALVVAYVRAPGQDEPQDGHELTFVWDGQGNYPRQDGAS